MIYTANNNHRQSTSARNVITKKPSRLSSIQRPNIPNNNGHQEELTRDVLIRQVHTVARDQPSVLPNGISHGLGQFALLPSESAHFKHQGCLSVLFELLLLSRDVEKETWEPTFLRVGVAPLITDSWDV